MPNLSSVTRRLFALSYAGVVTLWRRMGLLIVLALAGCGQAVSSPTAPSTSAPTTSKPAATPSPLYGFPVATGVTCPDLKSLGVQRALLRAADQDHPDRRDVVLCDALDPARPRTLPALEGSTSQVLLGRDLVGYVALKGGGPSSPPDQFTSVPSTLNLVTGQTTELGSSQGLALAAGWSPDASMVAYFTDSGGYHHYWLKRGSGAPGPFSTPAQVFGRGGSPDDQLLVGFSFDGQYVLVVDTFVSRLQVFRSSDGGLVYAAPSGGAGGFRTMAAWSHSADRFYFRNNSGVYQWDASSGISSSIAGLIWFTPSLSPSDQLAAYAVGASRTPHVETRDLSSGAVTAFAPWRDSPLFTSERTLLVHEEAPCDTCMGAYSWTGKTLAVRTDTRAETDLGIKGWLFASFWPSAGKR